MNKTGRVKQAINMHYLHIYTMRMKCNLMQPQRCGLHCTALICPSTDLTDWANPAMVGKRARKVDFNLTTCINEASNCGLPLRVAIYTRPCRMAFIKLKSSHKRAIAKIGNRICVGEIAVTDTGNDDGTFLIRSKVFETILCDAN